MFTLVHEHPDFILIHKHPGVSVHKDDNDQPLLAAVAAQTGDELPQNASVVLSPRYFSGSDLGASSES